MGPWYPVFICVLFSLNLSFCSFFRRGGGIDVGTHSKRNRTNFLFGGADRRTTTVTTSPQRQTTSQTTKTVYQGKPKLKVGVVVPKQIFQQRNYQKAISRSLIGVQQERDSKTGQTLLQAVKSVYEFEWKASTFKLMDEEDSINFGNLEVSSPPFNITNLLCEHMMNGSAAILYFSNTEKFGQSTAASQYFLKMAGFLGIPVIAWNADNTGLEKDTSTRGSDVATSHLQLAPGLHHQVEALLSILRRYNWHQFGILTSEIAGHDDFVQAIRDKLADPLYKTYAIQNVFKTTESSSWDLTSLAESEVRIILMYCTKLEAANIMKQAKAKGLTSPQFMWIVTQSVVGNPEERIKGLPVGIIGIHFDVEIENVFPNFMSTAMKAFFKGVWSLINEVEGHRSLEYNLSCQNISDDYKWNEGSDFFRHLKNVSLQLDRKKGEQAIFHPDGSIKDARLTILNVKKHSQNTNKWEEVGTWDSSTGLDIKDIVWPGGGHVPPEGVPDKFHMKITFLEEPPFIIISDPDPISEKCSMNRGVSCKVSRNDTKCCSGMCIDLLRKFENELGFSYDLERVEDPKWGTLENGKWNGLMGELVSKRTDMVLSALKINAQREQAADFTTPFLQTGIAIAVAKRTGIISPTAFLEPFDFSSWMLVALVAIQASTFAIFLFEWMSPSGYNMKMASTKEDYKFSLFRTYWLVWAVLFQASVKVDCPKGLTARFMSIIWALFGVVFLALYTANLAAFMIPREKYYDFTGIDDKRISNPMSEKPSLRFATIPYSYTQVTLSQYHTDVARYMKKYNNFNSTNEAIKALKNGSLDAFIYDGTVLSYIASQDEECRLLQVGSWSAMTGYSLAFPINSKHKEMFENKILEMRETGDLERLVRFWMNGVCKPNEQEKRASEPLSIAQFLSAFLLLGIGTVVSVAFLAIEHCYTKYLEKHVHKKDFRKCLALISRSVGDDYPARMKKTPCEVESINNNICSQRQCWENLTELEDELEEANFQIRLLEKQLEKAEKDRFDHFQQKETIL